jgi:hypothetical protein
MENKKYLLTLPIILLAILGAFYLGSQTVTNTNTNVNTNTEIKYGSDVCSRVVYANGTETDWTCNHNLYTTAGKNHVRECLGGGTTAKCNISFLAVGNTSTGLQIFAANTTLGQEITDNGLTRAECTFFAETAAGNWTCYKTFTYTGTNPTIVNTTGLFNASTTGTFFAGANLTTATLSSNGDTLQVNYSLWTA